ncbi:aspartate aminotransferase family protein [candidate division CSSED10-310 bacterium]|uniref:Aspartate aminotransferase family protein n=1 Tax=candidate division CSSED10-310 bacterium TaxID=2855610 RepID=A0ABV6YRW4_UNCC1
MTTSRKIKPSSRKQQALDSYRDHVSSGKAAIYQKYGMDFVMGRREGPYLWDLDGTKRLFNLHCNGGVFNLGHRHQELIDLLKQSLDELDIGNHHLMSRARSDLARLLAQSMPGDLEYTIFGVGGGEAVDLAFKVVRGYTRRTKIISARGGYHGHTGLALAAGDEKYSLPFGPAAPGFRQVPFNDIDALAREMDQDTAAVILETIPATLGIVIPDKTYIQSVRELCHKHQVLLILDEVQTGLGRTGKLWAFEHFDIIPDIVVLGKGLSGGLYPISGTILRKPLESVFHQDPFIHISTFGGAEIGCVMAQRVLEISSSPDFLAQVNILGQEFKLGIETLRSKHPRFLRGLRQLGLMMGLELKDELSGPLLTKTAYDHDLLLIYANNDPSVCQFLPPLIMDLDQVSGVMEQLDKALTAVRRLKPVVKIKKPIENLLGKLKS